RPPQGGSPHGPQLSHRPRWRSHQRRARRCRLQLQPAPALVRGAFTRPLVDPLPCPLGRSASPNPVPQNFLHGRLPTMWHRGGPMPDSHINDPQHWLERAKEARAIADEMKDLDARQRMLGIAKDYVRLAERAEARAKGLPQSN